MLESTIHSEVALLSKLLNLLAIDAPAVVTGVKGGERKVVSVSKGERVTGRQVEMQVATRNLWEKS